MAPGRKKSFVASSQPLNNVQNSTNSDQLNRSENQVNVSFDQIANSINNEQESCLFFNFKNFGNNQVPCILFSYFCIWIESVQFMI